MMTLRSVYDNMPEEDKEAFWYDLKETLKWRGWMRLRKEHAAEEVKRIGDLFASNGCEVMEYL